jgi:hypothetical protein
MKGRRAEGRGLVGRARQVVATVLVTAWMAGAARAETIDRVMAAVAGQVIMLSDVAAARELGLVSDDHAADPVGDALAKLISRELVLVEVRRYVPPEPADEAINGELAAVRARFPSREAYDAVLARAGITEIHLRETVRENLRIRAYIAQRFPGAESEARRLMLIDEWVAGLRQRADVVDLYTPSR